jgi:DNA topoisomerase III
MEKVVPAMTDPVLTAQWEEQLNQVEQGTLHLEQFEGDLGRWLNQLIDQIRQSANNKPRPSVALAVAASQTSALSAFTDKPTLLPCPLCASALRRISASTGAFWGCSGYPAGCRFTMDDKDGSPVAKTQTTDRPKPVERKAVTTTAAPGCECGKPMRLINGARGAFYGCSGYPECKKTKALTPEALSTASNAAIAVKVGQQCPMCEGKVTQRSSRGEAVLGCTKFPTCRFFRRVDANFSTLAGNATRAPALVSKKETNR